MSSVDVKEGIGPTSTSMETDKKAAIVTALELQSKTDEACQTSKETGVFGTITRGKRRNADNCSDTKQKKEVTNGTMSESSNYDDTPQVSENHEKQLFSVIKIAKKSKLEQIVSNRSKRKKFQPKKRTPVKEKNRLDYAAADVENMTDAADDENMIDAADEENMIDAADEENMIDAADEENMIDEENLSENDFYADGIDNSDREESISQKQSRRKNTPKIKRLMDGTEAVDDDDDVDGDDDDGDDDDDTYFDSDFMQNADKKNEVTFRCLEKYIIADDCVTCLSISCDCCGDLFPSVTLLKEHLLERFHVAIKDIKLERICECNYEGCFKRFSRSSNCKRHMTSVHVSERKYTCEFCAFSFKRNSGLTQHVKALHSKDGEFKFKCEVCDKRFRRKAGLDMHSSIHTDDKNYICSHENCGKQFRLQTTLSKHEKCVHSGEKPYECETCGERFTRKTYLRSHMYKHTGIKSYKCDVCFKTFTQNGNLMQHKISLHGKRNKSYQCPQCSQTFNFKSNLTKHLIKHDHHDGIEVLENYSEFNIDDYCEKEGGENAERNYEGQSNEAIEMTSKGIKVSNLSASGSVNKHIYLSLNKHDKNWVLNHFKTLPVKNKTEMKPVKPCDVKTMIYFPTSGLSENQTEEHSSVTSQNTRVDERGTSEGDIQVFVVKQSATGSCESNTEVLVPFSAPEIKSATGSCESNTEVLVPFSAPETSAMIQHKAVKDKEPVKADKGGVVGDHDAMCVNDGYQFKKQISVTYVTAQSDRTQPGDHISVVTDLVEVPDKTVSQLDNMDVRVETNQSKEPESVYVTDASVMNALEVILGSGEQQLIPASIISKPSTLLSDTVPISAFSSVNIIQGAMQLATGINSPVIMDFTPHSVTETDENNVKSD